MSSTFRMDNVTMGDGGTINNVNGNQTNNIHKITNRHNQDLIKLDCETQKHLEELERLNPKVTEDEQITYLNIASPNLKERWKTALKDASETAIDEFLLENKFLKVGKAFLMALFQLK
jgi:hypothetical protein